MFGKELKEYNLIRRRVSQNYSMQNLQHLKG